MRAEQELDTVIFEFTGHVSHISMIDSKGPLFQLSKEALSRSSAGRLGSLVLSLLLRPQSLEAGVPELLYGRQYLLLRLSIVDQLAQTQHLIMIKT